MEDAPSFSDIAEKVYRILHDKIFIAHNVNFDYSFVNGHLRVHGFDLKFKKPCTGPVYTQFAADVSSRMILRFLTELL